MGELDLELIRVTINDLWNAAGGWIMAGAALGALVGLGLVARLVRRGLRVLVRMPDAKLHVGFAVVQAGVTSATVTGVYEFFGHVLGLPLVEALIIAVFIESTVWVAVGLIRRHRRRARGTDSDDGGLGPAGPFFWVSVAGGGALAVLGSSSLAAAIGRAIIVALGGYMWWLRIREWAPATSTRSRWRWTPRRLLLALGAITPADDDIEDQSREWEVRRLARAIARVNDGGRLGRRIGRRTLARRSVEAGEELIDAAYRRYAAAHLAVRDAEVTSGRMRAVLRAVAEGRPYRPEVTSNGNESPLYVPPEWVGDSPGEAPVSHDGDAPVRHPVNHGGESPRHTGDAPVSRPGEARVPHQVSHDVEAPVSHSGESQPTRPGEAIDALIAEALAASDDPEVRMAWLWHATSGHVSGRMLGRVGTSAATGVRRAALWRESPPPDPRPVR